MSFHFAASTDLGKGRILSMRLRSSKKSQARAMEARTAGFVDFFSASLTSNACSFNAVWYAVERCGRVLGLGFEASKVWFTGKQLAGCITGIY